MVSISFLLLFVLNNFLSKSRSLLFMTDFNEVDLNDLVRTALTAHQEMRLDDAVIHYNKIIEMNSNIPSVYSNLGAIYLQQDNNIKARECFEKALAIEPNNASNLYNLAVTLTSKFQEHKLAFRHAVKALNLDGNNIKLYQLLGNLHQDLGKPGAEKFFAIAERLAEDVSISGENNNVWIGEKWASSSDLMQMAPGDVVERNMDDTKLQMTCLSASPGPLVFRVDNLLTEEEECQHIINQVSRKDMEKSFIMGEKPKSASGTTTLTDDMNTEIDSERSEKEPYRNSAQAWLPYHQDNTLRSIQTRIASLLKLPITALRRAAEELQVVKYETGGIFKVHHDSSAFHPRLFTCLIYLNTPDGSGSCTSSSDGSSTSGSTWFPYATSDNTSSNEKTYPSSIEEAIQQCSNSDDNSNGLFVKPTAGSAIIFFNHRLTDGVIDPTAVHSGEKLHQGHKFIANLWVGFEVFDKE